MRAHDLILKAQLHDEIKSLTFEYGDFLIGKDKKYGDAYSKMAACMKIMFPEGLPVDRMDDAAYMYQIFQKLGRIATDSKEEDEDPWKDIAGTAFHAQAKRNINRRIKMGRTLVKDSTWKKKQKNQRQNRRRKD